MPLKGITHDNCTCHQTSRLLLESTHRYFWFILKKLVRYKALEKPCFPCRPLGPGCMSREQFWSSGYISSKIWIAYYTLQICHQQSMSKRFLQPANSEERLHTSSWMSIRIFPREENWTVHCYRQKEKALEVRNTAILLLYLWHWRTSALDVCAIPSIKLVIQSSCITEGLECKFLQNSPQEERSSYNASFTRTLISQSTATIYSSEHCAPSCITTLMVNVCLLAA